MSSERCALQSLVPYRNFFYAFITFAILYSKSNVVFHGKKKKINLPVFRTLCGAEFGALSYR
jgi:hypothetical protein